MIRPFWVPSERPYKIRFPYQQRKPYIPPKGKGAKAMTIAAGFRCEDGVVLCADTEISIQGWLKYPGSKIRTGQTLPGKPCFTFAGDVDFCEMAMPRLGNAAANAIEQGTSPITALQGAALEIHQQFKDEEYEAISEILVCLELGKNGAKKRTLFKVSRGIVSHVKQACLGTGRSVAQGMVAELFRHYLTTRETALLCVFMLAEAKTYAADCGKESQILLFFDGGNSLDYSIREDVFDPSLTEIEEEYRIFKSFLRPLLLEYGRIYGKPEKLDAVVQQFVKAITRRRKYTFEKAVKLEEDWIESQLDNTDEEEQEDEGQN